MEERWGMQLENGGIETKKESREERKEPSQRERKSIIHK